MASQEIYSFVEKFHQLWNAGLSAHLDIDTHAGEAWVGLRVKLGNGHEHPSEYKQPTSFYLKPETSSRQRRRSRRAAARLAHQEATVEVVSNDKVEDETKEEKSKANGNSGGDSKFAAGNIVIIEEKAEIAVEEDGKTHDETVLVAAEEQVPDIIECKAEIAVVETCVEKVLVEKLDDAKVKEIVAVATDKTENDDKNDNFVTGTSNLNDVKTATGETVQLTSSSEKSVPVRPAVETVYAIAVVKHSLSSRVTSSDIDYLHRIIKSKDHLSHNIISVDRGSIQSYNEMGDKFEHKVQIMIHVKTANLWESSRSYIYHHLGKDMWNLQDGTEFSLRRIHQKT